MLLDKKGYSYNDITIIPEVISDVSSRQECDPFIRNNSKEKDLLPIFASPMASVISDNNYEEFLNNKIMPIIPRNIPLETRIELMEKELWVALSLKEFEKLFIEQSFVRLQKKYYICVDIANGHMKSLYDKCKKAKDLSDINNYVLTIMTGNIANPETYEWICRFNEKHNKRIIDYIRVGIGGGSGCITTSNVSIHYPQASLIDECYKVTKRYFLKECPYIVADGGIRNYDHVIKALALGANYVMIGSLFAQCIESSGLKYDYIGKDFHFDAWEKESLRMDERGEWYGKLKLLKDEKTIGKLDVKFFGMASADGQKSISGEKTKTSEGITKYLSVKYTLNGWVENMISYLRSAMSYTNCKLLDSFIGKPKLIINSISEIHSVNK